MAEPNEVAAAFEAELIRAVSACGIDPKHISLRYEDYRQDYDLIIGGGPVSAECVACVHDATSAAAVLSFSDAANASEHYRLQGLEARKLMREMAKGMPGLPGFDPAKTSLEAFARQLEVYCGIEPGTVLHVQCEKMLSFSPSLGCDPKRFDAIGRLLQAACAALADHDGYRVGVVGGGT